MQAIYRNKSGQQIEIRFIAEGDKCYLEPERGTRIPFTSTINDPELGVMTLVDDPRRLAMIEEINTMVYRFPHSEFNTFLSSTPDFRDAFGGDFAELPSSRVLYHLKQLSEARERLDLEQLSRDIGELADE